MEWLRVWHLSLCLAAVLNLAAYLWLILRHRGKSNYSRTLRWLAGPVVLECGWRSVSPALYLQRFTWTDSPLNGILLERSLACLGELAWNAQLAILIVRIDSGQVEGGRRWVCVSAAALLLTYVLAEGVSFYNTATTNQLFAAIEVALDGLSQLPVLPAVLCLLSHSARNPTPPMSELSCQRAESTQAWTTRVKPLPTPVASPWQPSSKSLRPGLERRTREDTTGLDNPRHSHSTTLFLVVLCLFFLLYPAYNLTVDVPMYLKRYEADQRAGKEYLPFGKGLVDAAIRRVPTQRMEDWKEDTTWMLLYFVLNPAAAIIVAAVAPGDRPKYV